MVSHDDVPALQTLDNAFTVGSAIHLKSTQTRLKLYRLPDKDGL